MKTADEIRRLALHSEGAPGERERAILLQAARANPAPLSAGPPPDWELLLALAGRHGLAALLARHQKRGWLAAPPAVAAALRGEAAYSLANSLRLLAVQRSVLRTLEAEGVPAIAFKGPTLSVQAYGAPGLRATGDVDVVVPRETVTRAERALRALGFAPELPLSPEGERALQRWEHHRGWVSGDGETLVELHWAFAPPRFGVRLDAAEVVARRTTLKVGGEDVPVAADDEHPLLLCVHGARHEWERLEWVASLGELLRQRPPADPEGLLARASRARGRRILLLGMYLAHALVDAPLPAPLLTAAERDPEVGRLAADAARRIFTRVGSARDARSKPELFTYNLRAKDGALDRFRYAMAYLTTPTEDYWYGPRLPGALFPLYRLYRPLRLAAQILAARSRPR